MAALALSSLREQSSHGDDTGGGGGLVWLVDSVSNGTLLKGMDVEGPLLGPWKPFVGPLFGCSD